MSEFSLSRVYAAGAVSVYMSWAEIQQGSQNKNRSAGVEPERISDCEYE